jgi:diadenylate cyclase
MEFINTAASFIWSNIRSIGIADILDMVIVAFLVYRVLSWVVRSGSARAIRGIILVIIVLWVATLLEMKVVSFLMGKIVELGLLALIVIFQPELRRMFEKVGSAKYTSIFSRSGASRELESAIDQTVLACTDLSRTRTGAIIVFERTVALDEITKTGTTVDSVVQAELLKNIFYPKAPLHDGAVIIRNARIMAAGCMLPLSSNPNLSRDLGMRHRAGIGMSEASDAVVVVVSEETGGLSVAVDGMLKRHLTAELFEKLLRNELLNEGADQEKKKKKKAARVKKNEKN